MAQQKALVGYGDGFVQYAIGENGTHFSRTLPTTRGCYSGHGGWTKWTAVRKACSLPQIARLPEIDCKGLRLPVVAAPIERPSVNTHRSGKEIASDLVVAMVTTAGGDATALAYSNLNLLTAEYETE